MRDRLLAAADTPWVLRRIFEDYDPHGRFDLDLTFVRPPDSTQPPRVTGTFRPRGASGRCRWFPYRVDGLHGQVRVAGRQVFLENLRGRHGSADIRIHADVDLRTHPAAVELVISGSEVPLDAALFDALSAQYQAAWRRISPGGIANIQAHLTRPPATKTIPSPAWKKSITVDLTDSQAALFASATKERAGPSSAPAYALEHLRGRLQIEADHVRLIDVTGDYRGAKVVIDGDAALGSSGFGKTTLSLSAAGLPLDDSLAAVLPKNRRETFRKLHATGLLDVSGTLALGDPQTGLIPDLRVLVHNGEVRDEHLPYRVSHVEAEVLIRPDDVSIVSASGTHGEARITADGLWHRFASAAAESGAKAHRTPDAWVMDLNLAAQRLALDAELDAALPPSLKAVWQRLHPSGQTQMRLGLHLTSTADHPSTRYRIELLPGEAAFRYHGFPLPISAATGRIIATPGRIEILALAGQVGGGSIHLAGEIDLRGPGMRGTLILNAEDLTFNDALLAAMPGVLGRFAATIKPTGRFSLRLDPLRFESDAQGRTQWNFDGRLEMSGAGADLGFALRQGDGTLAGSGFVDRRGKLALNLRSDLQKATLAGWHLTDLQAHLIADPKTDKVLVEDARAGLYGGEVAGDAMFLLKKGRRQYEASITAKDIQLSEYLAAHRKKAAKKGKPPLHAARGSIAAKIALGGRLGPHGYREGAGEVSISKAQVWKLPIIFAIFQVLNLTPDENVFHDGRLKFYLSRDTLTFQKIDLQGHALAFIGGGTLNLRTGQLDLTLLAGSPLRIRVPLLSEILERASREIMEVHVTGTLDHPTIRPQPLKSLAAALETIFPEAPRVSRPRTISPADNE